MPTPFHLRARRASRFGVVAAVSVLAMGLLPGCGPSATTPCGVSTAPATYQHVIWLFMENKNWSDVINNGSAPYETSLAGQCGTATNWHDAGSQYNSEPNYVAAVTGIPTGDSRLSPFTCDCNPSSSVNVTTDNLFRQVRTKYGASAERSYEEGMSANCSSSGSNYAAKHNPAMFMWGGSDRTACSSNDVPMNSNDKLLSDLRNNTLPKFSLITPNLCNDTHDCSVATGDNYLKNLVPQILNSTAYTSGTTALIIVWDEDTPAPNIVIAPSVPKGLVTGTTVGHYSMLRATEEMLGLPLLLSAGSATSLRSVFSM